MSSLEKIELIFGALQAASLLAIAAALLGLWVTIRRAIALAQIDKLFSNLPWLRLPTRRGRRVEEYLVALRNAPENHNIHLTPYAEMLLLLPVAEEFQRNPSFNVGVAIESLETLLTEMSVLSSGQKDAKDVVAAFYTAFCRIPPFCGRAT